MAEVDVPPVGAGEVLVRNLWMSVDPAMRPRMDDKPSYAPPFSLGRPLSGFALGEVVSSRADHLSPGAKVVHRYGWRDYALVPARHVRGLREVDAEAIPPEAHLGVLGHTGLTAWVGLLEIAEITPGDIVFVSGAAGSVGSIASQIASHRGHRVIGSAGSPEKVRFLTEELGLDAAFDYTSGEVREMLRDAAPEGIDVYFDNVGGSHLEAAIANLNDRGRIAICGTISTYNDESPGPGIRNEFEIVAKRLRLTGFLVGDHFALMDAFLAEVGPLYRSGDLVFRTTVASGLESAPEAFIGMLSGRNIGKMLVELET